MESSPDERVLAYRIRARTGKSHQTCLFCLKLARGNLQRAIQLCEVYAEPAEGGR